MKTKKNLFTVLILVLLTSCSSTSYFQVYKTAPSDKLVLNDTSLVYEDENCKVSYNLWSEGGNIGFQFFNKTDKNIYLNLGESFFILNGISNNYYKNRVFTNSTSSGSSVSKGATASKVITGISYFDLLNTNSISATKTIGTISSSGYSVSYNEELVVCIPSNTSKIISEYTINESPYRDCELFRYPKRKQIRTKSFSKTDSPFVFSNRIAYMLEMTPNMIRVENEFYVKEISNYPENEVIDNKYEEFCGQKSDSKTKYFKNVSADKFYVNYIKRKDSWKH